MRSFIRQRALLLILLALMVLAALGCVSMGVSVPVPGTHGLLRAGAGSGGVRVGAGYSIGGFSFRVSKAPMHWPFMNRDIEEIGGLPPKDAVRQGKVKNSPYTVKGRRYYPMTVKASETYSETGVASWYGYETARKSGGNMTANGEAFDPNGLTAAHKLLPLPTHVRVTNLSNGRSIIVRVNDRGPFPSVNNPSSGRRIIDLSMGAAKKLGFHRQGTARVKVETVRAG